MSCVKIYHNNFCDPEIYANLYESSEQTAFPSTNALARIRRSKVWRSNGYFKVTSSNNTIIFRDDAVTNITATIATGEYTTTAAFMSAVDSALEAVGAANYTVTQSSGLRFVITSDLSGGATAFQLRTSHASFTAESLLGFDNSVDKTGAASYSSDYLTINSGEWITFDMGVPVNPTDFALIGRRNESIKISPTAVIKLQGSTTNAWTSPEYTSTLTYNDEVILSTSATGFHTSELRYWRVLVEDQNPNGYIEVGSLFIGESYEPTRGAVVFPFKSKLIDLSKTQRSEGGQTFSDVYEKTESFDIEWQALTTTEVEQLVTIFNDFGTAHPFFISFDSGAVFHSTANKALRYVKFITEPDYTLESPNNFTLSMTLREEL